MKKKGFTLVELLAVIVILAIIAVIATPLILNVIDNAKKGAAEASASGYLDAIEKGILEEELKGNIRDKNAIYVIGTSDLSFVNIKGDKPTEGWVQLEKGVAIDYSLKIGDYVVSYNLTTKKIETIKNGDIKEEPTDSDIVEEIFNPCNDTTHCTSFIDNDNSKTISLGDEITFGTESFNVISNDGSNIKALAKYNLNVGDKPYGGTATGLQDSNIIGGYNSGYGNVAFSSDSQKGTNYSDYDGSIVKVYVDNYKTKLEELGLIVTEASLITKDELITLGCEEDNKTCNTSSYKWILNTSYWTKTAYDDKKIWYVEGTSSDSVNFEPLSYASYVDFGVRPVINITISEI